MRVPAKLIVAAVAVINIWSTASAQTCLHGASETREERERQSQALAAVRVINTAEANRPSFVPLADLADSPAVRALRAEGGPGGEAARSMRFDREEILPGWRVHFVLGTRAYAITLRDTRDPCGFSYVSDERGLILHAQPIARGPAPVVPTAR